METRHENGHRSKTERSAKPRGGIDKRKPKAGSTVEDPAGTAKRIADVLALGATQNLPRKQGQTDGRTNRQAEVEEFVGNKPGKQNRRARH
ncbi:hypothetical protein R1flu_020898 [Riccia fluitans]|uniref:Uncharacterized protein n=1 Tax=Riccia fluitans TaxID=41844 RepID=A0ABD1ZMU3_9MARC